MFDVAYCMKLSTAQRYLHVQLYMFKKLKDEVRDRDESEIIASLEDLKRIDPNLEKECNALVIEVRGAHFRKRQQS